MKAINYISFLIVYLTLASCRDVKTDRFSNGNIKKETEYKFGKKDGLCKEYFPNGNIKIIEFYKNGQLEGEKKFFYKTGQIEYSLNFVNNKRHGTYKSFYLNGKKQEIVAYRNNKEEGVDSVFFGNGKIKGIKNYRHGKLEGSYIEFFNNGRIKDSQICKNDSSIYFEKYDSLGNLKDKFRQIEIIKEQKNIFRGGEYSISLKLDGPLKSSNILVSFLLIGNNIVEHKKKLKYYTNGISFNSLPFKKAGVYLLDVKFTELEESGNSNTYVFSTEIEVKESPNSSFQ